MRVDGKGTEEGPTKTRRGERVLPLPPDLVAQLRSLREAHAAEQGFEQARAGYLAVNSFGEPIRPERWSDMWREHCKAAGVPVVTLHAARHTSVTIMRDLGVPDHHVAAWHGHDEIVMRRTYSHAQPRDWLLPDACFSTHFVEQLRGECAISVPQNLVDDGRNSTQAPENGDFSAPPP